MTGGESGFSARVFFHTLGCPKNDADSRAVERGLLTGGIRVTDDPIEATHIVINTCGFIQDAKAESIEAILSVCSEHADKAVLVMGCLVERYREELSRQIPEVSGWFGIAGEDSIRQIMRAVTGADRRAGVLADRAPQARGSYAYLKISDGCDESCTFCAIPGIKGTYRSVPAEEILAEADACLSEGAKELVLVGQDTTRWRSQDLDLSGLIDVLSEDKRLRRIRVMYLQPSRLTDSFLEFMAGHDKLCRYLDVPFQHSHREILRKMGRGGDGASYGALLERARTMMDDLSVRSAFIVGFPGETTRHFEDLMTFVESARFDYGGAFIYSPEEGTEAASLRPAVRRGVAQRRLDLLNEAILDSGERRRAGMVGTQVEVMVDSVGGEELIEGSWAVGRTAGQAPEVDGVTYLRCISGLSCRLGDVLRVRIDEVSACDLVGEVCAS